MFCSQFRQATAFSRYYIMFDCTAPMFSATIVLQQAHFKCA